MAGHSKFKNIMHRKGAQDAKRGKLFTKISREISVAAQDGTDPEFNTRLRAALTKARAAGLPKERMQRAIESKSDGNHEALRYGAYGPGRVGMIIECLTNNKKRTADEVRMILHKYDSKLQSTEHMFDYVGCFQFDSVLAEQVIEILAEVPMQDMHELDVQTQLFVQRDHFEAARKILHSNQIELAYEGMYWLPLAPQELSEHDLEKLTNLTEALEDNDDVQRVWTGCA